MLVAAAAAVVAVVVVGVGVGCIDGKRVFVFAVVFVL